MAFAPPVPLLTATTRTLNSSPPPGLRDAAVFFDDAAVAALSWTARGGAPGLACDGGAVAFGMIGDSSLLTGQSSHRTSGDSEFIELRPDPPRRVAFVLGGSVPGHLKEIKRCLLDNAGHIDACFVYSGVSEATMAELSKLELEPQSGKARTQRGTSMDGIDRSTLTSFNAVESLLRRWLAEGRKKAGNDAVKSPDPANVLISVAHFPPAAFLPISNHVYLLPHADFSPPLDMDVPDVLADLQMPLQHNLLRTAGSLSAFLDALNVQDQIYTLGGCSETLARVLVSRFGDTQRRKAGKSATLVILDRTADLLPLLSSSDNAFDQFAARSTGAGFDVQPDNEVTNYPPTLPLSHASDPQKLRLLDSLTNLSIREAKTRVSKKLSLTTANSEPSEETKLAHAPLFELEAILKNLPPLPESDRFKATESVLLALLDSYGPAEVLTEWSSLLPPSPSSDPEKFGRAVRLLVSLWLRMEIGPEAKGVVKEALVDCLSDGGPPASDDKDEEADDFDEDWGWGDEPSFEKAASDEDEEEEEEDDEDEGWGWGDEPVSKPAKPAAKPVSARQSKPSDAAYREWKDARRAVENRVGGFLDSLARLKAGQKQGMLATIIEQFSNATSSPLSKLGSIWGSHDRDKELKHHSYGIKSLVSGLGGVLRSVQTAAKNTTGDRVLIVFVVGGITGTEVAEALDRWQLARGPIEELLIGSGSWGHWEMEMVGKGLLG